MNVESIRKLNKQIEEHKHFQETIATRTETISSRLTKTKDTIIDELKAMKNELSLTIEQTDKFFNEQVETLQANIERNKVTAKEQLARAKDDLHKALKQESTEQKAFVGKVRDEINLQADQDKTKFEDKLKKIKEVCAQFFNKYDKQLTSYDD